MNTEKFLIEVKEKLPILMKILQKTNSFTIILKRNWTKTKLIDTKTFDNKSLKYKCRRGECFCGEEEEEKTVSINQLFHNVKKIIQEILSFSSHMHILLICISNWVYHPIQYQNRNPESFSSFFLFQLLSPRIFQLGTKCPLWFLAM